MIKVLINSVSRYPVNRKLLKTTVVETIKKNKLDDSMDAEVSVAIVGKRKMRQICEQYLKDDGVHEVIAFSFEDIGDKNLGGFINAPDGVLRLGDLVYCWPWVVAAAGEDNVMVDEELKRLTIHGTEHLMGKHHE